MRVFVSDRGGNALPDVPVQFQVLEGEGTIFNQTEITLFSDESGLIDAPLLMGTNEDFTSYEVIAMVANSDPPLMTFFEGRIVMPGAEEDTTFSGVVLDEGNRPLPGVEVFIKGEEIRTQTDAEGQFLLTDVPVGEHLLEVDGSTTSVPGSWPQLEFSVVTIAGQENRLEQPIYLLRMDDDSTRIVGGDQDVVLELAGVPGATLTVFANSVTGPNGESELPLTWTQVNRERVPMPPPLGGQFSVVTTVQPANTAFDPPARIQLPNIEGQPGQQIEMFSFDHDLMDYVSIGTGTVSDDGAVVTSDEGFGLIRAGWSGARPPAAPCTGLVSVRPDDTPCERWRSLPALSCAGGVRYVRDRASISMPEIFTRTSEIPTVSNLVRPRITVFTDETVTFGGQADFRICSALSYRFDFGDRALREDGTPILDGFGQSVSHSYEKAGTYTVMMTVQCFQCPQVNATQTVTIEVVDEDQIVEFIDSNGRLSSGGELTIVPPGPVNVINGGPPLTGGATLKLGSNISFAFNNLGEQSETVRLRARNRDGGTPDEPLNWEVRAIANGFAPPPPTVNLEGAEVSLSLAESTFFSPSNFSSIDQVLDSISSQAETRVVFLNGERVGTIDVLSNTAVTAELDLTGTSLFGLIDRGFQTLNRVLEGNPTPVVPCSDGPNSCLLYTSPSPRDRQKSRMPSSA